MWRRFTASLVDSRRCYVAHCAFLCTFTTTSPVVAICPAFHTVELGAAPSSKRQYRDVKSLPLHEGAAPGDRFFLVRERNLDIALDLFHRVHVERLMKVRAVGTVGIDLLHTVPLVIVRRQPVRVPRSVTQ